MESFEFLKDLALIIVSAKLFGLLANKLKAPQVVGEIIAGLIIGFTEVFVSAYTSLPIPKDSIAFIVLIAILLIKPEGLMGQKNKM